MNDKKMLLEEKLQTTQKILVGIGEEFGADDTVSQELLNKAYERLAGLLEGKDYFVVTLQEDGKISQFGFDSERVVAPCKDDEAQWKKYQEWLSFTLNKELLILELGVGFSFPNVIRWPFEKVAFYNNKAYLFRVHGNFSQLTPELAEKGNAVNTNSVEFCANL